MKDERGRYRQGMIVGGEDGRVRRYKSLKVGR